MKEKKVSPLSASSKPVGTVLFHHFELVESPSQSGRVLIWESLIHCSFSHISPDALSSDQNRICQWSRQKPLQGVEPKSRLALLFPLSGLPSYTVTGSQYIGKQHWTCLPYPREGLAGKAALLIKGPGVPCFRFVGIPARISMTKVCSGPK